MGKQRTIYASDEEWDRVGRLAKDFDTSISKLLLGKLGSCQLDRIESKLDQLICGFGDMPVANYDHKDLVSMIPISTGKEPTVSDVIYSSENKTVLDSVYPDEKIIIKTKGGPVKTNAAMENFFKPQPKAKWKGAK